MSRQPANDRLPSAKIVPLLPGPVLDGPRPGEPPKRRGPLLGWNWLVVSILAHLVVIEALLFGIDRAPEPPPVPVLQIALVIDAPGSAGAMKGDNAPAEAPPVAPEPQPEPAPPVEAKAPEPVPVPVIETPPPPPVEAAIPPPAPELKPEPVPEPPKIEPPKPPPVAEKPRVEKPKPKPRPKPDVAREAPPTPSPVSPAPPSPSVATLPAPNASGAPGANSAANQGHGTEGAGQGAIGNSAGPGDEYLAQLYKHLLRFKKYPADSLARKEQGAVVVGFTIARDGTISNPHVVTGSGFAAIDEATVAMLNRASPAPPLPDSYKAGEARIRISISYKLGVADELF